MLLRRTQKDKHYNAVDDDYYSRDNIKYKSITNPSVQKYISPQNKTLLDKCENSDSSVKALT